MLTRNCLLLFLWILSHEISSLRLPTTPLSNRVRGGQAKPKAPVTNGVSGAMQRVKRGWVWNQFFVLEEYMGSDPQYVGKVRKYI
uniref:Cadherin N-terminal domain-containing protein n=1 Tax=Periophthalmus magnuspinnatus TaxID=409849 RepID=A0A3B4B0S0_9GOBI